MDWSRPQALYLILPVSIGWLLLSIYSRKRKIRAGESFVAQQMSNRILPVASPMRYAIKLVLQLVAVVSGLVALAGPRYGDIYEQITPKGSDLYIMIDVSRSMLAEDVPPSRLARAKTDVASLVNRLEGERVGLIAFAGQAVVKCPLTIDYTSFRRSLDELDTNSAPRGGTAIGDAIRKALEVFQSNSERDQAILLITDGDDQQSYPLDAAALAAERKVTIFAIGLGDTTQGARIPQKDKAGVYMEHNGEQVWSKLDNGLLQDIALKTSGVYVPAGTKSYDLGDLYFKYLQGKRGDESTSQTRIRKAERFQVFLAIALVGFLIEMCIRPYRKHAVAKTQDDTIQSKTVGSPPLAREGSSEDTKVSKGSPARERIRNAVISCFAIWIVLSLQSITRADNSTSDVRKGVRLFSEQKFDEAQQAFAAASEKLEKENSKKAPIAIFDEACALHRKGDFDKAREKYLQAGLSQDRALATASHFNLGMLSSEKARSTAGDHPESVTTEQRKEIIEELKQSIASYRHCLELDPKHGPSRKNLELVRQWIKFYTDKWAEIDRQKRRDETSLLQFLEFLMSSQAGIKKTVSELPANVSTDSWAEIKRIQDELAEEIPVLKSKLDSELRPNQSQATPSNTQLQPDEAKEIEQAIQLLQSWADAAGKQMSSASTALSKSEPSIAMQSQTVAEDELNRIWEAVVNFHPLLDREVKDQTAIADILGPKPEKTEKEPSAPSNEESQMIAQPTNPDDDALKQSESQELEVQNIDWESMIKKQDRALVRARMLGPKAESELAELEQSGQSKSDEATSNVDPTVQNPSVPNPSLPNNAANATSEPQAQSQQMDPEKLKEGYRKAIDLAPKAVEEMMLATQAMAKKSQSQSALHAREAERILKEIQESQPKNPPQDQNQNQQDQNQQDQQNQNQDNQNSDQQNKDENKDKDKEESSKDTEKQNDKKEQPQDQKQQQNASNGFSKDRLEEALRKVREREQEKHDRDRQLRARVLGRTPVDKDW